MILLILILFIVFYCINKKISNKKISKKKVNGICAFDIDGTILQGKNNTCYYKNKKYNKENGGCTSASVQACLDKNYLLAVNTASNRKIEDFCCDVGLCKNGKCLVDKKNWWNNQKYYSLNTNHGSNHGGCGKTFVMKQLCKENNIKNYNNAVLWDDYYENLSGANSMGFGTIAMPNIDNDNFNYIGIKQKQLDDFIQNKTTLKEYNNYGKNICKI
tara:strand:- start:3558 stop:4205 length:648 start_codon:yes stop_codon:yes gene_type:complete